MSTNFLRADMNNFIVVLMAYFEQSVVKLQQEMMLRTPVKTGYLRNHVQIFDRVKTPAYSAATVGWRAATFGMRRAFYAPFVNDGTGIYGDKGSPIVPKRAKYLKYSYTSAGVTQWVTTLQVKGQRPKQMVEEAADATKKEFLARFQSVGARFEIRKLVI